MASLEMRKQAQVIATARRYAVLEEAQAAFEEEHKGEFPLVTGVSSQGNLFYKGVRAKRKWEAWKLAYLRIRLYNNQRGTPQSLVESILVYELGCPISKADGSIPRDHSFKKPE